MRPRLWLHGALALQLAGEQRLQALELVTEAKGKAGRRRDGGGRVLARGEAIRRDGGADTGDGEGTGGRAEPFRRRLEALCVVDRRRVLGDGAAARRRDDGHAITLGRKIGTAHSFLLLDLFLEVLRWSQS